MSVTERTEGEKRAYLAGFRAGIIACADHGRNAAEDMAAVAEGTLPQQPRARIIGDAPLLNMPAERAA